MEKRAALHNRVERLIVDAMNKTKMNPYTGNAVTRAIHADGRTIAGYAESGCMVQKTMLRADICVYEKDKRGKERVVLYEVKHTNNITMEKIETYRGLRIPAFVIVLPKEYQAYGSLPDAEVKRLLAGLRPVPINTEDRYILTLPSGKTCSFRQYRDTTHAVQVRAGRGGKKIMLFKYKMAEETVRMYEKSGWDCYRMAGYDPLAYFGQNIDRCRIVPAA